MGRGKSKHINKRRKAYRRQPELGEYGSFSIKRLQRALDAETAEAHSKGDGAVEIEREPSAEQTEE